MTADVIWKPLSSHVTGPPPPLLDRTGVVALVPVGDRAWAAGAAVTLARSLARGGRRVFIFVLYLEAPRLHDMVGVVRGVGVSDYTLYGASPSHVATEVEDGLLFVSAGTPVAGLAPVFESARWEAFIESYHAIATHPQILPYTEDYHSQYDVWGDHISRTITALGVPSGHLKDITDQDVVDNMLGVSAIVARLNHANVPEGLTARE